MIHVLNILVFFLSVYLLWILTALIFFSEEIKASRERDPAAKNALEIASLYSGLHAIMAYRMAHGLWKIKIPLLPRLISQTVRFLTGTEIT